MSEKSVYIVAHNVIHLQEQPNNSAERVSQARMGQRLTALRQEYGWAWVEGEDTYRGWADLRWVEAFDARKPLTWVRTPFADVRREPEESAPLGVRLPILAGVHVGNETKGEWSKVTLTDGITEGWLPTRTLAPYPVVPSEKIAAAAANWGAEFLGTPYLWGGSSSFGLDCSGFVQLCCQLCGITLRRDADIQRDDPRFFPVEQNELQPGDLVFFGKPHQITHVGMHFTGDYFIHSAGGAGVIVTKWGEERYSPLYVDARRLDIARAAEPVTRVEADNR